MTREYLEKNATLIDDTDIRGRLYQDAYEGSKKTWLLPDGQVFVSEEYQNRTEYMGENNTVYVGTVQEIIEASEDGMLVPPDAYNALAKRIEQREEELAGAMREMISLGWTWETFDSDFDNCDSDEWTREEKETCRKVFRYVWDDVQAEMN